MTLGTCLPPKAFAILAAHEKKLRNKAKSDGEAEKNFGSLLLLRKEMELRSPPRMGVLLNSPDCQLGPLEGYTVGTWAKKKKFEA